MSLKSTLKQLIKGYWGSKTPIVHRSSITYFVITVLAVAVVFSLSFLNEGPRNQIMFAVSLLTLFFLIRYSYDTYLMRKIQHEDYVNSSLLDITFHIINPVNNYFGGPMPPIFQLSISNQSNKIVKATVNCVFCADGKIIDVPEPYTGIEKWLIFPKMEAKGFLPLVEFIKSKGIDWKELANSQNKDNKNKKLYVNFDLVFEDEFGKARAFRKIKYYYVFNSEQWIPDLAI